MKCKFCGDKSVFVNSFGMMPIANGFQTEKNFNLYEFELATSFCDTCKLFQLINQPDRTLMFHKNYPFFSSSSNFMIEHFRKLVSDSIFPIIEKIDNPLVIEIGSNDGTLLENLASKGVRHLGIDPSENVVQRANSKGIKSIQAFFGRDTALSVKNIHGPANIIVASNVICHLPDLIDLMTGIDELLDENGVFIFEEPYLGSMLELVSFDQIYDEHVYIFSLISISNICEKFELELFDAIKQETHGGSMRYFVSRKGKNNKSQRLNYLLKSEVDNGLDNIETYLKFKNNCEEKKNKLTKLIKDIKSQGKSIAGYAATSKSTTVLNYCGIDYTSIEYICDTTPEKIGKFSPSTNIPIVSIDFMHLNQPDYLILFAWNHEVEIMEKERNSLTESVKWIKFVPKVEISNF
jgi:methylation protein EvaC